MTVSRGAGWTAVGWLCDVTLRCDGTGARLSDSNPSCTDTSADPVYYLDGIQVRLVVHGTGRRAMHTATYTRRDTYIDGTVTNCDQMVIAPMTKQ